MAIKVKRVYDPPSPEDGYRVLVDRLWPRGLSQEAAHVDLWMRDVAPTTELRTWYGHEIGKWPGSATATRRNSPGTASFWT